MLDLLRLQTEQGEREMGKQLKKGEKRVPKAAFDKGQAKQHLLHTTGAQCKALL